MDDTNAPGSGYRHAQRAWYPFPVLLVVAVLVLVPPLMSDEVGSEWLWFGIGFIVLMALLVLMFSRLVVTVDDRNIVATFGWGWPKKVIPIDQVIGAEPVRNSWWHGWGIRWLGAGTWMYNVQGLDAVEIERRGASPFRIGTDEPTALLQAIRDHM